MKIIIVGGGIGGLATYHALRKHLPSNTTISIYEAYPNSLSTTTIVGGGIGLAPNGQRSLASISPSAVDYITSRGMAVPAFTFRNEQGKLLGRLNTGDQQRYGFSSVMVPRAVVHESLLVGVDGVSDMEHLVTWGKKVKEVRETASLVEVLFEDGAVDTCDLLIGADGVRSICKEAVVGNGYPADYDGLTGIGGFLPFSSLSPALQEGLKVDPMTMTFSRSGFFGLGLCSNPSMPPDQQQMMWWSTYAVDPPLPRDTPPSQVAVQLLGRHGDWSSPYDEDDFKVFKEVITMGCTPSSLGNADTGPNPKQFLVLPRYITPELPHWTSASTQNGHGRIFLLGDAAHAMPPDSGQGVSCAAEDALTISLLLKGYLGQYSEMEAIRQAGIAYEALRIPRVKQILAFAKRNGNQKREISWLGEKIRDWALWIVSE
ncbi:hypothetical protein VNI00_015795 [Paramarasmius palmivorus]|uniref:FAD-binding domain-containing protein n=1 Tax=Paramarasmius palmivorus TaxID=297713 RepID=A0AAW0BH69_9AGAR